MARRERDAQHTLRLSVLDRLIDDEPQVNREPPLSMHEALRRVLSSVRRDLEWLFNARTNWFDEGVLEGESATSAAAFGIPDLSHENLKNSDARVRLQRTIEAAICTFEPRLQRVVVTPGQFGENERHFTLRIDAVLCVEPLREPVVFDTVLESGGTTTVRER